MSKSIGVTSILTCKENFIINLFENIICCAITFLYYKRNRKTRLVRLWCDNALVLVQWDVTQCEVGLSLSFDNWIALFFYAGHHNICIPSRYIWGLGLNLTLKAYCFDVLVV